MPDHRFDHLEGAKELPVDVKNALSQLNRFEHLEIGGLKAIPPPQPRAADKALCLHCGQPNEKGRETCWACYRFIGVKEKPATGSSEQEITLVLDGTTYRSIDPDLPPDIKVLMDRIRKEGYNPELLTQWRSWRATRNIPPPKERPFDPRADQPGGEEGRVDDPSGDIRVFKGQRVSVIRMDGAVYTSDDPKLTPELRQLFDYIERNGVTPALMEYLRQFGKKVKYRPATTATPSDGDVAFWDHVNASAGAPRAGPAPSETDDAGARQAEIASAQALYWSAWGRMALSVVIFFGLLWLYYTVYFSGTRRH